LDPTVFGELDWVDLVWPMMGAACLSMASVHFGVWLADRARWAHLCFAGAAATVAVIAGIELYIVHAGTAEQAIAALRAGHVALFVVILFLAGFVHLHFGGSRRWLVVAVVAMRTVVLILAFALPYGVNYGEIRGMREVEIWGGARIGIVDGSPSPWAAFPPSTWLLMIALIADSAAAAWRRAPPGGRARVARLAGALVLFIVLAPLLGYLQHVGVLQLPYLITAVFCPVVFVMAIDLTSDLVRADRLRSDLSASERRLRASEERVRVVLESAPSALLMVDPIGRIEYVNQRAAETFGYRVEELQGKSIDQLVPERVRGAHLYHRAAFAAAPTSRAMGARRDLAGRRRDGSEFPIEVALAPIPGERGDRVIAAVVDISSRRQDELGAARLRAELAHLSRVATLGELSASLAHEINQPLAAILANAQAAQRFLARGDADPEQLRDILHDIAEDDKRAGEVIRRLRAMLRKEELPHARLDLNELVHGVLRIVHSDLVNRGIEAQTDLDRERPAVAGDPVQLQQVLLNLILNACDAMSETPRPRRLILRTRRLDGAAQLEVRDFGHGIPEAELGRVFEPFVTTKPSGTGLGLSVCRTIVSAHRGRIWASRPADGGVTMTITLPAAAPPG
jgi:PAS domain S-box-containing protein